MGTRGGSAMVLVAALGAVGPVGLAACAAGGPPVFRPAAPPPSGAAAGPLSAEPAGATLPPGVRVRFLSPLPTASPQRGIVLGYEGYTRSLWTAVATRGADSGYRRWADGMALTYARRQVAHYRRHSRSAPTAIRYFDTEITGVYFGDGAAVTSCVDVSGRRFRQDVAEARRADGTWFVARVDDYPTSSSQGAMCR